MELHDCVTQIRQSYIHWVASLCLRHGWIPEALIQYYVQGCTLLSHFGPRHQAAHWSLPTLNQHTEMTTYQKKILTCPVDQSCHACECIFKLVKGNCWGWHLGSAIVWVNSKLFHEISKSLWVNNFIMNYKHATVSLNPNSDTAWQE